jgi:hypothetical protein
MTDDTETVPEEPTPDSRPGSGRRAVVLGARIASGLVGVGIAAVVLLAAAFVPFPTHTVQPRSEVVSPVSTVQQRVCAGPLLRLGTASGEQATQPSSFGRPVVRSASATGHVESAPLAATDNVKGVAPQVLSVPAESSAPAPVFAGSQTQSAQLDDYVGFAASGCAVGSGDSWLVGGSSDTGRTTLITLSNPSGVDATVTLTIYSETGAVVAAGTDGIVVKAGSQKVLPLAGFAPGIASPVVRVQSRGGSVVANLQQTTVRVLDPGGVDIIDPTSPAGQRTVIPGVVLTTSDAVAASQSKPGYDDLAAVIRAVAPGDKTAQARITLIPQGASAKPIDAGGVTLKGGIVTDFALGAYPDGTYTIVVDSDRPVVASARTSTVDAAGLTDFAWWSGAAPIGTPSSLAVAPGPNPVLTVANSSTTATTVSVKGSAGTTTVAVPANRSVTVAVLANGTYLLTPVGAVSIAVSYSGDAQLAGFALTQSAPASQPIRVYG